MPRGVHPAFYPWHDTIAMLIRFHGKPVLIAELRGANPGFVKKYTAPETRIEPFSLDGNPAVWVDGARHVVEFQSGEPRLAGNVLLMLRDGITVRIEGDLSRSQALEIARSLR